MKEDKLSNTKVRIPRMVEDLDRFHHLNKKGVPKSVYDYAIYKDILENYDLFVFNKTIYIYDNECEDYKADTTKSIVSGIIKSHIYPKFIKSATIGRIYRLFFLDDTLLINEEEFKKKTHNQWESDTVQDFLSQYTKKTKCDNDRTKRSTLYRAYKNYCYEVERQYLPKSNFFYSLKVKGYSLIKSCGEFYYTGLLLTDTVEAFLSDCIIKTNSNTDRVNQADLYKLYFKYCVGMDRSSLKKTSFFRSLEDKGYTRLNSNGARWFTGLQLSVGGKLYNTDGNYGRLTWVSKS